MDDDSGFTHLDPPAPKKGKKERTPAQKAATAKALEILQQRRKEQWEAKKQEMTAAAPPAPAPAPAPAAKPAPKVEKTPKAEPPKVNDEMPEWAKALEARLAVYEKPKRKKRVIVEESDSSSEEEVVIRRKKTRADTPPPPPPAAPAVVAIPENPLRRMIYRR